MSWSNKQSAPAEAGAANAKSGRKGARSEDREYWRQKALADKLLEVEKLRARREGIAVDEEPKAKPRAASRSRSPKPRGKKAAPSGPKKTKLDRVIDRLKVKFTEGVADNVTSIKPAIALWMAEDMASLRKELFPITASPAIDIKTEAAVCVGHGVGYDVYFNSGVRLGRFQTPPRDGVIGFSRSAPKGFGLAEDEDTSDEDAYFVYGTFKKDAPDDTKVVAGADLTHGFAWRQMKDTMPLPNLEFLKECVAAPGPPFRVVMYDSTKNEKEKTTWVVPGPSWLIRDVKDLFSGKEIGSFRRVAQALHTNTILPLRQESSEAQIMSTCLSWYSATRVYSLAPKRQAAESESHARVSMKKLDSEDDNDAAV